MANFREKSPKNNNNQLKLKDGLIYVRYTLREWSVGLFVDLWRAQTINEPSNPNSVVETKEIDATLPRDQQHWDATLLKTSLTKRKR